MRYTSKKLITLWIAAAILIIIKLTNVYDVSWWWIICLIILSFTTFRIGGLKI